MRIDDAKIGIRPLDRADLDTIIGIAEILKEAPQWPRSAYEEALKPDSSRPRIALVAYDTQTDAVAGFAVAGLIAPEAELETIAVAEHAQRRGIGRRLLSALVTELRHGGIEKLLLEVRASNLAAIRFYEAANFRHIGARVRYYADPQEDAVQMSLRLG